MWAAKLYSLSRPPPQHAIVMPCLQASVHVTSPREQPNCIASYWHLTVWSPHRSPTRYGCLAKFTLALSVVLCSEPYPAAHDPANDSTTVGDGVAAGGVGKRERQKILAIIVVLLSNVNVRGINGCDKRDMARRGNQSRGPALCWVDDIL